MDFWCKAPIGINLRIISHTSSKKKNLDHQVLITIIGKYSKTQQSRVNPEGCSRPLTINQTTPESLPLRR